MVFLFGKGVSEMPIYEYHCSQCEHEFEKLVFNSSEKIVCPKCKSKKVNRMMSAFAFSSGGKFKSTASPHPVAAVPQRAAPPVAPSNIDEFLE